MHEHANPEPRWPLGLEGKPRLGAHLKSARRGQPAFKRTSTTMSRNAASAPTIQTVMGKGGVWSSLGPGFRSHRL
jgi:hypothetical protein